MKLRDLAEALEARLVGDGAIDVERAVHPADASGPRDLALAMEPSALALLDGSRARAAVVAEGTEVPDGLLAAYVVVGRPRYAMAGLMELFRRPLHAPDGVHPTAVVEDGANLAGGVRLGAFAFVGAGAEVGADTVLMDHVSVGAEAQVGAGCLFHPGVRVGERVVIGDRVILHHNASIGADGFGFATPEVGSVESAKASVKTWGESATHTIQGTNIGIVRINSNGTVILEDDVEVGACSTVDRATVRATVVGRNTKIDNLVAIGHNTVIGESCLICGQVGIGGSCTIGDRVVLAGQVGVSDHLSVGSDSVIGGGSGVGTNVPPNSVMAGYPAMPIKKAAQQLLHISRLRPMSDDLKKLKERVKAIEAAGKRRRR